MTARQLNWDEYKKYQPEPDICARKHKGSVASKEAFSKAKLNLPQSRALMLAEIRKAGERGVTASEVAEKLGLQLNKISGRFSELKKSGEIYATGERRNGSGVLRARS